MSDVWLCISVGVSLYHGNRDAVERKLRDIFGKDLREVRFVCNDVMWSSGEYFIFVLCSNYESHISSLKRESAYLKVVPSVDRPSWISPEEVNKFTRSVKAEDSSVLGKGDIVRVKNGHLKNLFGIVLKKSPRNRYSTLFRLCTRKILASLHENNLQKVGNILKGTTNAGKLHRQEPRRDGEEETG
jgi:hypothetical protein